MTILSFPKDDKNFIAQAEDLLEECFPHAYGGDLARQQMALCLGEIMGSTGGSLWLLPALAGLLGAALREIFGK